MVAFAVEGNVGEVTVEGNVVVECNYGEVVVEGNVTEDTAGGKWLLSWSRATLAKSWSRAMLLRTRSRGERLRKCRTGGFLRPYLRLTDGSSSGLAASINGSTTFTLCTPSMLWALSGGTITETPVTEARHLHGHSHRHRCRYRHRFKHSADNYAGMC